MKDMPGHTIMASAGRVWARRGATTSGLLLLAAMAQQPAAAAEEDSLRHGELQHYELVIETGLPHLGNNLRYTATHERRRLSQEQLFSAFPLLNSSALAGCRLHQASRTREQATYTLVCEEGSEASGTATWRIGERLVRGILHVKLGGKNMTIYQRVSASRLPPVDARSARPSSDG